MGTTYNDYISRKKYGEYSKRRRLEREIGIDTYDADFKSFVDAVSGGNAYRNMAGFEGAKSGVSDLLRRTEALKAYVERYGGDASGVGTNINWLSAHKQNFDNYADYAEYEKLHNYDFETAQRTLDDLNKQLSDFEVDDYRSFVKNVLPSIRQNGLFDGASQYVQDRDELRLQAETLEKEILKARLINSPSLDALPDFAERSIAVTSNPNGVYWGSENDSVDWQHEYIIGGFDQGIDSWYTQQIKSANPDAARLKSLAKMSNEEIARYNYFYNTQGKEVANQYLDALSVSLLNRLMQDASDYATDHPVLGTLGSIGISFLGAADELGRVITGDTNDLNYYSDLSDAMTSGVSQNIDSDFGKFLYNTGVSGLQSLAAGTLLGPAGGVALGLSAMASTRNDLLRRGADTKTATMAGIAAGIFEGLFETISLGQFGALKEVPVNSFKDLALNLAKSAGVNASEEMATEIANVLYDTFANGDFSNAQLMLREYMAQGMSEEEAKAQIAKEFGLQIAEAGASGALMGVGFGGVGSAVSGTTNAVNAARVGKSIKAGESSFGSLSSVTELGEKYGIKQAVKVKAKGTKASNRAVGDLYRRVSAAVASENKSTTVSAIEKRLSKLGTDSAKSKQLAEVVLKKYMRRSLSLKESRMLDHSKVARQALGEMLEDANSKWINDLKATLKGEASRDISTIGNEDVAAAAEQAAKIARSEGAAVQVAASGETLGALPQIASVGANGMMLASPSGDVALDDAAMTEDKAMLYTLAGLLPSAEIANAFVAAWDGATDPNAYFRAFQMIYTYGRNHTGYSDAQITEAGKKSGLSEAQIAAAFKSGVKSLAEERRMERERLDSIVTKFRESGANRPEGKWDAKALRGVDLKKVVKENVGLQDIEQFLAFLRMTTKAFGWNVRVIADNAEGHSNGGYNPKNNTLTFNVYSGTMIGTELVRTAMPNTISHETLHWMKRNAPKQYHALEDMVLAALKNANDYDFDAAVKREYGKYKEKYGQNIDDPTAREEIVARACEDLFGRSEAIKQFLADFAEKNKEAATGFTAAVKKVLAKIKAFFENLMFGASSRTLEAGIVRKCGTDVVQGLQEQYEKTFFAALEGNAARNALGEFEQGGVRYSSNDSAEDDSIKEQLKKHSNTLDAMEPVSDVNYVVTNKGKARKDASEVFKNAGYRVDRQGFGIIEIGEKQLTESSNYLNAPAEFAAWMSIPKVLKRGAVISGHSDHKQRGFPSITIAAPVVINGKRGNVAVVVQQKGKNKYHVHRILMPDGSKFVYENIQQNAEPTGDSIVRKNPHKGLSIGSASNISISQNTEMSTPDAKKLLKDRVSGDDLLNAQDLIADVQELGGQVDEYGYITLYHRTSADKAAAIHSTGEMVAKEDGLFFSTKIDGQNVGYGDTVVTFSIPAEKLLLDDIFDDEAHLRFPLEKPGRVSVKEYLVSEDTGETGLHSDPEDDVKSDREILAAIALEDVQNTQEYAALKKYQAKIKSLDAKSKEVVRLNREIDELRYRKGKRGPEYYEQMDALVKERNKLDNEIRRADRLILKYSKPLQDLVVREKKRTKELWRAKGEQALSEQRERQIRQAYCKGIESKAKNLLKKLRENTDKHHIPDAFKEPVAQFLSLLDFSSNRLLNGGDATKRDTELQEAFQLARDMLAQSPNYQIALQQDKKETDDKDEQKDQKSEHTKPQTPVESFLTDLDLHPQTVQQFIDLGSEIDRMVRGSDTFVLNRMSSEQLKTLNTTLYALTRAIKQSNELFATDRLQDVTTASQGLMEYCDGFSRHSDSTKLSDFLEWDNLRPKAAFARFGGTGDALFQSLWGAQNKFITLVQEFEAFTSTCYTEQEIKEWLKTVHTFRSENGSFSLTTTEIMTMYALWKSEDGRRHLTKGGMTLKHSKDAKNAIKKVHKKEAKGKYRNEDQTTSLTEGLVKSILSKLTDRQKEVADAMQKYMSERGAELGNEISLKRWGIKIYGMRDYFSIESNPDFMTQDQAKRQESKTVDMYAILFPGFRHKRNSHADNPIIVRDFFDTFAGHMTAMAKYNAFSFALLDIRKIMNYQEGRETDELEKKQKAASVRDSMRRAFGDGAQKYIEQLLVDLNGDIGGRNATEGIAMHIASLNKIAAVGYNLRVALLQFTSYVRVMDVLDPKAFAAGLGTAGHLKICIERMKKYSAIAQWKDMGYRDTNIATPLQTKIKHSEKWHEKFREKSMILAEWGDKITWGMIWHACEVETRDKHADLKVGSEEYYHTVTARFEEVIVNTQVVDSVLTKSQLMRSKNGLAAMLTSFMSEPTATYSLLASSFIGIIDKKRRGERVTKADVKHFVGMVGVFAIGAVIQSFVESFVDAARAAGEDDEEYWERYGKEYLSNFVQEIVPFNLLPYVKEIWSIAWNFIKEDYLVSSSRMDLEVYNRIAKATKAIGKMFEDGEVSYSAIHKILSALSSATGLPISNLIRDVVALWNTIFGGISKRLIIN